MWIIAINKIHVLSKQMYHLMCLAESTISIILRNNNKIYVFFMYNKTFRATLLI